MRARTAALGGAALLVCGIAATWLFGRSDLLQDDGETTREAVLARIPVGTDISRAQTIMEAEGFTCRRLYNTGFAEDTPGGGRQTYHPPTDILWCDSGERATLALFASKRWQVTFVDIGGSVSRVAVGVGLTGL
jgi:hypothetical protein